MSAATVLTEAEIHDQPPIAVPRRRRRFTVKSTLGQVVLYALLVALAIIYIYPFLVQVATSFKSEQEAALSLIHI